MIIYTIVFLAMFTSLMTALTVYMVYNRIMYAEGEIVPFITSLGITISTGISLLTVLRLIGAVS